MTDNLPVPVDDGAATHLQGAAVPSVVLPSTLGGLLDLRDASRDLLVVYVYPRTGRRVSRYLPVGMRYRALAAARRRAARSATTSATSPHTGPR